MNTIVGHVIQELIYLERYGFIFGGIRYFVKLVNVAADDPG